MYEYESELLGESCELGTPWKGCRFATIIEDYGKELLVQVSNGAEVTVLRDEVFILCPPNTSPDYKGCQEK